MTEIPLKEYLKENSQQGLADDMRFYQSAISNMVASNREIYVCKNKNRVTHLKEIRIIKPKPRPRPKT